MKTWTYKNFLIHQFAELESSNSYAFEQASLAKIFDHGVILTDSQKSGKGRKNRNWISPHGNLYFSLLLRPKIEAEKISQISFVGILALRKAVKKLLGDKSHSTKISNKWPNDLLIDDKKCAGLLLESKLNGGEIDFIVLGIGLNLISNPKETIFPATNLGKFGVNISAQNSLKIFLDEFEQLYQNWRDFGFSGIRQLWLQSAFRLKEKIIIGEDNKTTEGIFEDIDDAGNLKIRYENEICIISAADIFSAS